MMIVKFVFTLDFNHTDHLKIFFGVPSVDVLCYSGKSYDRLLVKRARPILLKNFFLL